MLLSVGRRGCVCKRRERVRRGRASWVGGWITLKDDFNFGSGTFLESLLDFLC